MFRVHLRPGESTVVAGTTPPVRVTYLQRHVWTSGNAAVELRVDEEPSAGNPMEVYLDPGSGLVFDAGSGSVDVVWWDEDTASGTATFRITPLG